MANENQAPAPGTAQGDAGRLRVVDDLREVLRQTRSSILGWQPDEPSPLRHQMALALRRINDALDGASKLLVQDTKS